MNDIAMQMLHWSWSAGWSPEQWDFFRWHQQQRDEIRNKPRQDDETQEQQKPILQKSVSVFRSAVLKSKGLLASSAQAAEMKKEPPVLDHISDVFSWGLIVVELFAGRYIDACDV